MTNEEAINILRQYIGLINTDDDRKTFEMAIDALKKSPYVRVRDSNGVALKCIRYDAWYKYERS